MSHVTKRARTQSVFSREWGYIFLLARVCVCLRAEAREKFGGEKK
jgi:hypothetical protein